jgi:hypothetical protein
VLERSAENGAKRFEKSLMQTRQENFSGKSERRVGKSGGNGEKCGEKCAEKCAERFFVL